MNKHQWRNGFAVGLTFGICCIAIVAFLSLAPIDSNNSTSEWVAAVAAIISSITSLVAVVLVGSTLKTTEETLSATKKLGLNQTRAWVLVKEVILEPNSKSDSFRVVVVITNYGKSPAVSLDSDVYISNDIYPFWTSPIEYPTSDFSIRDLPPGGSITRTIPVWQIASGNSWKTRIRVGLSYTILDETIETVFDDWVVESEGGRVYARKWMPIDSANHPSHQSKG